MRSRGHNKNKKDHHTSFEDIFADSTAHDRIHSTSEVPSQIFHLALQIVLVGTRSYEYVLRMDGVDRHIV